MTHLSASPKLPGRPRPAFRHLLAAGLIVATGLIAYPRHGEQTAARATSPPVFAYGAGRDDLLSEAFLPAWPEYLSDAVGMFQCWSAVRENTSESIVIWTDREARVVAFGAALEGARLPAYARAMGDMRAVDTGGPIQVADRRHVVQFSGTGPVLPIEGGPLSCVPTWDD